MLDKNILYLKSVSYACASSTNNHLIDLIEYMAYFVSGLRFTSSSVLYTSVLYAV